MFFVQTTVKAAGYGTKPHINTIGDDTSQFSKTYRPSENQEMSKRMETLQTPQTRPKNEIKLRHIEKFELHFRRTHIPKAEWI